MILDVSTANIDELVVNGNLIMQDSDHPGSGATISLKARRIWVRQG